jgi:hypothetical protein
MLWGVSSYLKIIQQASPVLSPGYQAGPQIEGFLAILGKLLFSPQDSLLRFTADKKPFRIRLQRVVAKQSFCRPECLSHNAFVRIQMNIIAAVYSLLFGSRSIKEAISPVTLPQ